MLRTDSVVPQVNTHTLRSLIYVSSATRLLDQATLMEILEVSRRHNASPLISGILIYRNGQFLQLLEGSPEAVGETMRRIEADPRHRNLIRLLDQEVPQRHFGSCLMAFPYTFELTEEGLKKYHSGNQKNDVAYGRILRVLDSFRNMCEP